MILHTLHLNIADQKLYQPSTSEAREQPELTGVTACDGRVWRAIFVGYAFHIILGVFFDAFPILVMNHYHCWGTTR